MTFWFNRPWAWSDRPGVNPGVTTGPSPTDKRRALQQQRQQTAVNIFNKYIYIYNYIYIQNHPNTWCKPKGDLKLSFTGFPKYGWTWLSRVMFSLACSRECRLVPTPCIGSSSGFALTGIKWPWESLRIKHYTKRAFSKKKHGGWWKHMAKIHWTPGITNQHVSACFSQASVDDVTSLSVPTYWEERGLEIWTCSWACPKPKKMQLVKMPKFLCDFLFSKYLLLNQLLYRYQWFNWVNINVLSIENGGQCQCTIIYYNINDYQCYLSTCCNLGDVSYARSAQPVFLGLESCTAWPLSSNPIPHSY